MSIEIFQNDFMTKNGCWRKIGYPRAIILLDNAPSHPDETLLRNGKIILHFFHQRCPLGTINGSRSVNIQTRLPAFLTPITIGK